MKASLVKARWNLLRSQPPSPSMLLPKIPRPHRSGKDQPSASCSELDFLPGSDCVLRPELLSMVCSPPRPLPPMGKARGEALGDMKSCEILPYIYIFYISSYLRIRERCRWARLVAEEHQSRCIARRLYTWLRQAAKAELELLQCPFFLPGPSPRRTPRLAQTCAAAQAAAGLRGLVKSSRDTLRSCSITYIYIHMLYIYV